ncbi:MAG TPA: Fe-S-containing protein [Terriglobales bacterium]|jgi:FTR1 family protein|nr:Fe-S-containing protein [Terriglobales bacterium]
MLEALVITLREGVEAALIVGITLAYLAKIGRADLRKVVFAALGTAFVGSIAAAIVLSRAAVNQEAFEGWVMLAAAFFVVTMIIFMARAARALKGRIENRVGMLAGAGSQVGLFLFILLMVLREGAETVLILSAVSFNSSALMSLMGTVLGIGLAVLFGVMFVKGSVRINLQKFFHVTSVILVFVAVQLVVSGLHELSEASVLPSSKREMAIIGPIVRNDMFFFVTILALAALMILFEYRRRAPEAVAASRAEQRKAQWTARRERLWMASVYASSFVFIMLVTAQFIYAKSTSSLTPATPVVLVDGKVTVSTTQLQVGQLERYVANLGGTEVRFFLYRKPDNQVAVLLDACEICGGVGFYAGSAGLICKNCTSPINPMSVGQAGGCNPIPLKALVEAERVTVTLSELSTGAKHFGK